jgi:hypothetical protein
MRPYNLPSKWVKVTPWYYTSRKPASRGGARRRAIELSYKEG